MRLVYWTIFPNLHQRAWIDGLRAAGCDVEVCYFGAYDAYRRALGWIEPALPPQEHRVQTLAEALRVIPDYAERTIILTGYVNQVYHENVRYCERHHIPWRLLTEETKDRWQTLPLRRAFGRHVNRSAEWAFALGVNAVQELIHRWSIHPEKVVQLAYVTPKLPIPPKRLHEGFRFVYAGSYVARKAIDILAAAWQQYAPTHPKNRLRIIGPEPLAPELAALPQIEFTGPVPPERIPEQLTDCDCGVLVSRVDGWGMVLAEFARSGLRLIGSDHCGASETLIQPERNGYIVPMDDVTALVQAMEDVPTLTPEHSRLSETFAEACVEQFLHPTPATKPEHIVYLSMQSQANVGDIHALALKQAKQGLRVTTVLLGRSASEHPLMRECRKAGVTITIFPHTRLAAIFCSRALRKELRAILSRATQLYLQESPTFLIRYATHVAKLLGIPYSRVS